MHRDEPIGVAVAVRCSRAGLPVEDVRPSPHSLSTASAIRVGQPKAIPVCPHETASDATPDRLTRMRRGGRYGRWCGRYVGGPVPDRAVSC